ncbi:gp15 domain protein [Mycobacterium xenopi 3993]|nr:gp15 domain protein [Mycobacterium xenopi 3993]
MRDLIASIDAKQQSEFSWLTHDLGYWWAPIRWFKGAPPTR